VSSALQGNVQLELDAKLEEAHSELTR
jgi:hypothetical protein